MKRMNSVTVLLLFAIIVIAVASQLFTGMTKDRDNAKQRKHNQVASCVEKNLGTQDVCEALRSTMTEKQFDDMIGGTK